jgi:hypothetical protein
MMTCKDGGGEGVQGNVAYFEVQHAVPYSEGEEKNPQG